MEKFYLDLATILQRFRQNGEISADLPAKKLGNKVSWKAQLRVDEGLVISCQILDKQGTLVNSGEPALEALYKLGPLHWEIIPDLLEGSGKLPGLNLKGKSGPLAVPPTNAIPAPIPAPAPMPAAVPEPGMPEASVPYRLLVITLKQMNQTQWPRNYRLVYILIDGIRTTEKIASMLAMPLADVEQILRELQVMRIIEIPV